jgi:hypothetical protein
MGLSVGSSMSGVRTPSLRLSRPMTRTLPPSRRKGARKARPGLRARLPHRQAHRFARVTQRQGEEPRAPVLARVGVTDRRAIAVVDVPFLGRSGRDHDARLRRRRPGSVRTKLRAPA